jgi:hypothetical protein
MHYNIKKRGINAILTYQYFAYDGFGVFLICSARRHEINPSWMRNSDVLQKYPPYSAIN